jgi:hypothetical protein
VVEVVLRGEVRGVTFAAEVQVFAKEELREL